jgi:NAD kinase
MPLPGPIVRPGIMMLPLVPTCPRVERLRSRAVDVAPTS